MGVATFAPPTNPSSEKSLNVSNIPQLDGNDSILSTGCSKTNDTFKSEKIPVHISNNFCSQTKPSHKNNSKNLKTVKRSNKTLQALSLPTVINLNPRSVYNKQNEFHDLVNELQGDLLCLSESWERENLRLDQIITLEDHQIISNVYQRTGVGGRPAIIVNNKKFLVENLTNTVVNIPYGVEIVWALLTPRNITPTSIIKKIVQAMGLESVILG